jgi:hypothetical protein
MKLRDELKNRSFYSKQAKFFSNAGLACSRRIENILIEIYEAFLCEFNDQESGNICDIEPLIKYSNDKVVRFFDAVEDASISAIIVQNIAITNNIVVSCDVYNNDENDDTYCMDTIYDILTDGRFRCIETEEILDKYKFPKLTIENLDKFAEMMTQKLGIPFYFAKKEF